MPKPEIQKKFVVSTAHITLEENNDLQVLCDPEAEAPEWCEAESAREFEYGFDLYVGCDEPNWRHASDHLKTLISMAWAAGCQWLTLDCDGIRFDWLPEFDW